MHQTHNRDAHKVCCTSKKHNIRDDVVVISRNGAALRVSESDGICGPGEDLLVTARLYEGLHDIGGAPFLPTFNSLSDFKLVLGPYVELSYASKNATYSSVSRYFHFTALASCHTTSKILMNKANAVTPKKAPSTYRRG